MIKFYFAFLFFISFIKCNLCQNNLERKREEFDRIYSILFKMPFSENASVKQNYEKHKLMLEGSVFITFVLNYFESVELNKLKKLQKDILREKMHKFNEQFRKYFYSVENNCELWKFWRGIVYLNFPMKNNENVCFEQPNEIDLSEIECREMEAILRRITNLDYFPVLIREYVTDCQLTHIKAMGILLKPSADDKQREKSQILNYWKFTEFFDELKIKNESKFTQNLRIMAKKCREEAKCEEIVEFKRAIKKLVGPSLFLEFEFQNPLAMAFDIIGDKQLSSDYTNIFSKNATNAKTAETVVTIRQIFVKLFKIFSNVRSHYNLNRSNAKVAEKLHKIFTFFEEFWTQKLHFILTEIVEKNSTALLVLYGTLGRLSSEHNKMPTLGRNERITTGTTTELSGWSKMEIGEIEETIRADFYEEYAENMVRFYENGAHDDSSNEFSNFLEQCELDECANKFQVRRFYAYGEGKNGKKAANIKDYAQLIRKQPKLKEMLRFELNDEKIIQIQIRNYLKFMAAHVDFGTCIQAKYLLNILAYYQSFKKNERFLPNAKREQFDNYMAKLELLMNGATEFVTIEEANEKETQMMLDLFNMKNSFFDKKLTQIWQNVSYAENIALFLFHLHENAIGEMLKRKEFTEKLKKIQIDKKHLAEIIFKGSEVFKQLLMESDANSDAPKNIWPIEKENGQNSDQNFNLNDTFEQSSSSSSKSAEENEGEEFSTFEKMVMNFYRIILVNGKKCSTDVKKQLGINIIYFNNKSMIFDLMKDLKKFVKKPQKNGEIFAEKLEELKKKVEEWELSAIPTDGDEKRRKICQMQIFMGFFMGQTIKKEALEECEALRGLERLDSNFQDLHEIDCENAHFLEDYFDQIMASSPEIEAMNTYAIIRLLNQFPQFVQFVNNNSIVFEGIRTSEYSPLDGTEIHNLYKIYFEKNGEKMYESEAIIGIKFMLNKVKKNEIEVKTKLKEWEKSKMAKIRAQIFAILKILDIYADGFESRFRMLCPLIEYKMFFDELAKRTARGDALPNWQFPFECLSNSLEQIMIKSRIFMFESHLHYMQNVLVESKTENGNDLVQILREKAGAFKKMEILMGKNSFNTLWHISENREKLFNQNFFNDKKRLFAHYYNSVANQCENERAIERLMADLIIIWNFLFDIRRATNNIKLRKEISKLTENFWLSLRNSYDELYLMKKWKIDVETISYESFKQQNIFKILVECFDELKKRKNLKAEIFSKNWHQKKEMAEKEAKKQWEKAEKEKIAKPNEMIQKMHFDQLKDIEQLRKEKQLEEIVPILEKILRENQNNSRENLLSLLLIEDRNRILWQIENGEKENNKKIKLEKELSQQIDNENDNDNEEEKKKKKNKKRNKKKKEKAIDKSMEENTMSTESTKRDIGESREKEEKEKDREKEEKEKDREREEKEKDREREEKEKDREREEKEKDREKEEKEKDREREEKKVENKNNKNNKEKWDGRKSELSQTEERAINDENLGEELNKFGTFKEFCEEFKLNELYKDFVWSPSVEKLLILELASTIFETKQRIEAIEQLENVEKVGEKSEAKALLIGRFEQILGKSGKTHIEFEEWQGKAAKLLADTLEYFDKISPIFYGMEIGQKQLETQIVTKHFAFAILNCSEIENLWKMKKKEKALNLMRNPMEIGQFQRMAIWWEKMLGQIRIDKALHQQFTRANGSTTFLMPTFPKVSQSIEFFDGKNYDDLKIYLHKFISAKSAKVCSEEEFDEKINNVINSVHQIVNEWSGKRGARLLLTGSHLLGTHTFDSDIDLICVVPGKSIKQTDYFGKVATECKANECRGEQKMQTHNSLFCILCEDKNVNGLVKIKYGRISMLKFKFDAIDVDISFVFIPNRKILPLILSEETVKKYLNKFYMEENDKFEKQIQVLSSYCSNLYIKNLLMEGQIDGENSAKILKNFRLILTTLKVWAKSNFIYSNKFGYLNGVTLTIMATKIVLLYPNASLIFLLEKFFLIYTKREIKVPIKLKMTNESEDKKHFDEKKFVTEEVMRIYTPSVPEQNAAKYVTHSTEKAIRKNMENALSQIKNNFANGRIDWSILISNSKQFTQMFDFFILINCMSESEFGAAKFCQFVESRIRLQLVYDIDTRGGAIKAQLYPEIYQEKCKMSEKLVNTTFRMNFCKVWLVGLNPYAFVEQAKKGLTIFDWTIKRAFFKYNPSENETTEKEGKSPIKFDEIEEKLEKLKFNIKSLILTVNELKKAETN